MQIRTKQKDSRRKFHDRVFAEEFNSKLEIPSGRDHKQNAWLTITINYSLNYVDRGNLGGRAYLKDGQAYIRDSNNEEFQLKDWDFNSQISFNRRFLKGANFWNHKFLLITPQDYDGLDFHSMEGQGWVCRPNVICLFRLSTGSPTHLTINAVRPDHSCWQSFWGTRFRSNDRLYKEDDVNDETLWHELGHALDMLHIKALQGDAQCMVDINADRCYEGDNIMGNGRQLELVNAKPWRELISHHTDVPQSRWDVTQAVATPPRAIPLGAWLVAKPTHF